MLLYLKIITPSGRIKSFKNRCCKFHPERWNSSGLCQYIFNDAGSWVVSCPSLAISFPYLVGIPEGTVSGHFQPTVQPNPSKR